MKNSALRIFDQFEVVDPASSYEFNLLYVDRTIPLEQNPNLIFKRVFDLAVSMLVLIFLFSWLLPLIALMIKLDSRGPVFFYQKRNKKNGSLFTCIKFRTMIVNNNADTLAATVNDCRITKAGFFLRKHHLDELPQLLNVIRGDMSLVGPRPYMVSDNEKYGKFIKNYLVRFRVKPGITGLGQVMNHENPITNAGYMEQRLKRDLYYVYHWSPLLDTKILIRTFLTMFGLK